MAKKKAKKTSARRAAPKKKKVVVRAKAMKDEDKAVRRLVGKLVGPTTGGSYTSRPWLLLASQAFDDLWQAVSVLERIVHLNDNTNKGRPVLIDPGSGRSAPPPPPTFP